MIYLDYNATTPINKEVQAAMEPYLFHKFGNPSSYYQNGIEARKAVDSARQHVADLISAKTDEIVFVGNGSEANNHALKGVAFANKNKGRHIIVSEIEHPSVLETVAWLSKNGFDISYIPVNEFGIIKIEKLKELIRKDTILISVMLANNEVGSLQPIADIAKIAKQNKIILHSDAAQAVGKINVDVNELGVDLLTIAGHKFYAPKGIGALYIKTGTNIDNLIHGASQEFNKRAGTENLLEIVGIGHAAYIAKRDFEKNFENMKKTRDFLFEQLNTKIPSIHFHTNINSSLPNTLSVAFPDIQSRLLLPKLADLAVSAGAACHSLNDDVSGVMKAMNVPANLAMGTVRFSTGAMTTKEEISEAVKMISEAINKMGNIGDEKVKINLTEHTKGLGCACKIKPQILEKVINQLDNIYDKNVKVGYNKMDDAAVYQINSEQCIVQTIDFFTPIIDNPYDFGAISAANALSDIYAMGGKPLFALNIVTFPTNTLPIDVLSQILKGAGDIAQQAEIPILGGHSVEDDEPKFGMCVTGIVHPDKVWKNVGANVGDALMLTKPLGSGIISTALKMKIITEIEAKEAVEWMKKLNKNAANLMQDFNVHACTDITGFGLIGHLSEMCTENEISFNLEYNKIPFMPDVQRLSRLNTFSGGTFSNKDFYEKNVIWDTEISDLQKNLLFDSQTSGGLVFAVPQSEKKQIEDLFKSNNEFICCIGSVDSWCGKKIRIM